MLHMPKMLLTCLQLHLTIHVVHCILAMSRTLVAQGDVIKQDSAEHRALHQTTNKLVPPYILLATPHYNTRGILRLMMPKLVLQTVLHWSCTRRYDILVWMAMLHEHDEKTSTLVTWTTHHHRSLSGLVTLSTSPSEMMMPCL